MSPAAGRDRGRGPADGTRANGSLARDLGHATIAQRGRVPSRLLSLGLAATALVGCAHGPIKGRFNRPGQPPAPAVMTYRSSVLGGSGELSMTLPTGEHFTGRYQLAPQDPKRQMTGNLTGNRGSTMVCHFTLNEPGVGPDGGGTVQCQLSASGGDFQAEF